MSTPAERAKALVWAGGFLVQISRNRSLPLDLRRQATVIARHFPTIEDVVRLSTQMNNLALAVDPPSREELQKWCIELEDGSLTERTRLGWPD